jgi:hypothetical protein
MRNVSLFSLILTLASILPSAAGAAAVEPIDSLLSSITDMCSVPNSREILVDCSERDVTMSVRLLEEGKQFVVGLDSNRTISVMVYRNPPGDTLDITLVHSEAEQSFSGVDYKGVLYLKYAWMQNVGTYEAKGYPFPSAKGAGSEFWRRLYNESDSALRKIEKILVGRKSMAAICSRIASGEL